MKVAANLEDRSEELHAKINTVEDEVLQELRTALEKILLKGSVKVSKAYKEWKKSLYWSMNIQDVVEDMARLDADAQDWGKTSLRYLVPAVVEESIRKTIG